MTQPLTTHPPGTPGGAGHAVARVFPRRGRVRARPPGRRRGLGRLYLARGGELGLAPRAVIGWALRRARRVVQQGLPAAAPTAALMAAAATVATLGALVSVRPGVDAG